MIQKTWVSTETEPVVRVTFSLPSCFWADRIALAGEFNGWSPTSHLLQQDRSGEWRIVVDLTPDRAHAFCYLCDRQWLTDPSADGYIWDTSGRNVFLVLTDEQHVRPRESLRDAPAPALRLVS